MADQPYIPEDDKDLGLAVSVGEKLQSSRPLSGIDDPIIPFLMEYKEYSQSQGQKKSANSTRIWRQIQQQTSPESRKTIIYPIKSREKRWVWAAAASILIIITAGLLYYLSHYQEPTLIAESGEQVETLTLEDGSRITLRPFSKIYRVEKNNKRSHYMLTGEGYFEVVPDQNRIFSVTSGKGRISVLGTKFVLSNWGGMVQVYLQEGSIKLEALDHPESVVLEPGQFASLSETELIKPQQAESNFYTDWLNNELSFENQRASYVFAELEQHFNITIVAPDEIKETKIGGTLRLDSLELSLGYLELILDGSFKNRGEKEFTFTTVD